MRKRKIRVLWPLHNLQRPALAVSALFPCRRRNLQPSRLAIEPPSSHLHFMPWYGCHRIQAHTTGFDMAVAGMSLIPRS